MKPMKCLWCEGEKLVEGKIQGTGRVYFVPSAISFFAWATSEVDLLARVCSDCGYVDLYADTTKIKKLTQ